MVWIVLAALGVPLWLCVAGILMLVLHNRSLRKRPGDIPVRVRLPGKKRWTMGHGIWVSDVFAFRASPAGWKEDIFWANAVSVQSADEEERKKLHRIGDDPAVASLNLTEGGMVAVAARGEHRAALAGPFGAAA